MIILLRYNHFEYNEDFSLEYYHEQISLYHNYYLTERFYQQFNYKNLTIKSLVRNIVLKYYSYI
jgi:hypothetical protein